MSRADAEYLFCVGGSTLAHDPEYCGGSRAQSGFNFEQETAARSNERTARGGSATVGCGAPRTAA